MPSRNARVSRFFKPRNAVPLVLSGKGDVMAHYAERMANVPVLSYAEPRDPNAIYTFLGLATLPRLRPGNPLRLLPREMVLKIARFAHGYRAGWEGVGRSGELAAVVDVSDHYDVVLKMPPMRSGVHYVEMTLGIAWYGTRLFFESPDNSRPDPEPDFFGLWLNCWAGDAAVDIFYVSGTAGAHQVDMQRVGAFVDNWTWCDEPVIIGCLVDVVRGCVTFRLNGIDGPCVRFPDFPWQSGVRIGVDFFPDCGGARAYENPTTGEVQYYPRCVVSCASPKAPPSMLAEAEHPMTAAEHLARGPDRPLSLDDDVEGQARDFLQTHELD